VVAINRCVERPGSLSANMMADHARSMRRLDARQKQGSANETLQSSTRSSHAKQA
jgi:hypothetical protein